MGRRDLDRARPEGHVDQLGVQNDGQPPAVHWMDHMLSVQMRIPALICALRLPYLGRPLEQEGSTVRFLLGAVKAHAGFKLA
jgi:hypothetical protein